MSQWNAMASQKVLSFNAREAQHFGNLPHGNDILAVRLKCDRLERPPRHVPAGIRKSLGNLVRDVQ